ncbi:MAG: Na(+)-translocating NADH-quinone reductase subunit C [Myxococcales bacterium FL481]|nr:MAG: Na(+)-translocating NADH-quinone reductase subunit C [Myxococcales bacterium FL481]
MKTHSTGYIFGFAAAVCLVCSIFVSGAAVLLKPRQEENRVLDRQSQVLTVAGLIRPGQDTDAAKITELFDANIVAKVVDLKTGAYVDDIDAASFDQQKAAKDPATGRPAPENDAKVAYLPNNAIVYQVKDGDNVTKVILPIEGKGLWSTLYGYLALASDVNTIEGITFYKHGETPGLGGEVDNPNWKALWRGRKAFDEAGAVKISVIKGLAGDPASDPHRVDGLSGATITSRGVSHLVQFWLGEHGFAPYLAAFRKNGG